MLDQSRGRVDPDMRLHPEVPLVALLHLMHLRVARLGAVLRRRRASRMVASTIVLPGRRPSSCWVIAASSPSPSWCRSSRCRKLRIVVDRAAGPGGDGPSTKSPAPTLRVVERVFHRRVAEVVEQLHAVNPQQQGQRIRGPAATGAGGSNRADARFEPAHGHQDAWRKGVGEGIGAGGRWRRSRRRVRRALATIESASKGAAPVKAAGTIEIWSAG